LQEAVETLRKQWIARGWGIRIGPFNEDSLLNLRFADDLLLFAKSLKVLKKMMTELQTAVGKVGLHLHMGKTKILCNAKGRRQSHAKTMNLDGEDVEILTSTDSTKYLGRALAFYEYHDREIRNRITAGWGKFTSYKTELCNRRIPFERRLKLFNAVVTPTVLYGSCCWTMTVERERSLKVARRRMLRKVVQVVRQKDDKNADGLEDWVTYIIRATQETEKISEENGVADWVLEQRRRKWKWAGHVARMEDRRWTNLALLWCPSGQRAVGRPTKRWEDSLEQFAGEQLSGRNWISVAKDRTAWAALEKTYVKHCG
jgi:hypothetical protein